MNLTAISIDRALAIFSPDDRPAICAHILEDMQTGGCSLQEALDKHVWAGVRAEQEKLEYLRWKYQKRAEKQRAEANRRAFFLRAAYLEKKARRKEARKILRTRKQAGSYVPNRPRASFACDLIAAKRYMQLLIEAQLGQKPLWLGGADVGSMAMNLHCLILYAEGKTYRELGDLFNRSVGRMQHRVNNAIRFLRRRRAVDRKWRPMARQTKVIDMGGADGEWHHFTPKSNAQELGILG